MFFTFYKPWVLAELSVTVQSGTKPVCFQPNPALRFSGNHLLAIPGDEIVGHITAVPCSHKAPCLYYHSAPPSYNCPAHQPPSLSRDSAG